MKSGCLRHRGLCDPPVEDRQAPRKAAVVCPPSEHANPILCAFRELPVYRSAGMIRRVIQRRMTMQLSRRLILGGLITAVVYSNLLSVWAAETGITIEAVDQYSCGALSNNIANVD